MKKTDNIDDRIICDCNRNKGYKNEYGCDDYDYDDDFDFGSLTRGVGDYMPERELDVYHKDNEKKIKLSDYEGQWLVLFFYPADFTFICPTELEEMADHYSEFQKEKAEIISVSTDTVFTHKAWHDTSSAIGKIKFPMASDRNGKLSRLLGVYIENEGNALRGSFIVDPDGKIVASEINDNSIGRNAVELLRKLRAAKFVYEHKGQGLVCPANWNPGDDTMKPGMDLVGKI